MNDLLIVSKCVYTISRGGKHQPDKESWRGHCKCVYCHRGGTSAYNSVGVSIQVQVLLCEYSPSNIYCHWGDTSAYNSIGVSIQVQVLLCEYSPSNIYSTAREKLSLARE